MFVSHSNTSQVWIYKGPASLQCRRRKKIGILEYFFLFTFISSLCSTSNLKYDKYSFKYVALDRHHTRKITMNTKCRVNGRNNPNGRVTKKIPGTAKWWKTSIERIFCRKCCRGKIIFLLFFAWKILLLTKRVLSMRVVERIARQRDTIPLYCVTTIQLNCYYFIVSPKVLSAMLLNSIVIHFNSFNGIFLCLSSFFVQCFSIAMECGRTILCWCIRAH